MIFFEKLLKERFGDEKRQELWEKYTYRKRETADTSYLVEIIQDQQLKKDLKVDGIEDKIENEIENEIEDGKKNENKKNNLTNYEAEKQLCNKEEEPVKDSVHPQHSDIVGLLHFCKINEVSCSSETINHNSQQTNSLVEDICALFKQNEAYTSFQMRKKNSKSRKIKKPHPQLLTIQRALLKSLAPKFPQHKCAYGFVKGKSTHHHVERHAQSTKYLVMDIQNFFNSCTLPHVATALESHTTLSQSQIKALLFLSMEYNFEETHHRKTSILTFFQSIQRSLLSYIHESIGRRLGRLIARMAFHRTPFLHTHEHIFDEHFFIDIRKLHDIHQNMWSKDPYQLESFFGLRLFVLFKCILGHYDTLPTAKQALSDARNYAKQKKLHIDTVSTFMKTGVPTRYSLPQGSPLSPWLANLCCYELDVHLQHYAQKNKLIYSRYADDICLSGSNLPKNIVRQISSMIEKQGFRVQREKTRFLYPHQRQVVTGFILNSNYSHCEQYKSLGQNKVFSPPIRLPKNYLKKIRSVLHYLDNGRSIHNVRYKGKKMTIASLRGHLAYIKGHQPQAYSKLYRNSTWLQNNEI